MTSEGQEVAGKKGTFVNYIYLQETTIHLVSYAYILVWQWWSFNQHYEDIITWIPIASKRLDKQIPAKTDTW
jgi:hypothetical protein